MVGNTLIKSLADHGSGQGAGPGHRVEGGHRRLGSNPERPVPVTRAEPGPREAVLGT